MGDLAQRIVQEDLGREGQNLLLGGIPATELVRRYGSPLYVYDLDIVSRDLTRLRQALPSDTEILYSVKANPLLAILNFLGHHGCGAEVASAGELTAALESGFSPHRIFFAGPGKSRDEHLLAQAQGIHAIHIESLGEAQRLTALGGRGRIPVGIRVNPAHRPAGAGMRMSGGPQQFGTDEEELGPLLDFVLAQDNLRLCGLHAYTGTQLSQAPALVELYAHIMSLAATIADRLGAPLEYVNLGGGFAVALHAGDKELDLGALAAGLNPLWDRHRGKTANKLYVEPGRFLVARAGVFLCRVVDTKVSRGHPFLVCDGGMNHNALAAGTMGQVFKKHLPVVAAGMLDSPLRENTRIVGPLCTPVDELARDIPFPAAEPDEVIAFLRCGAYAYSASHLAFLSRPTPGEVVITNGLSWLVRKPGDGQQWTSGQIIPPGMLET